MQYAFKIRRDRWHRGKECAAGHAARRGGSHASARIGTFARAVSSRPATNRAAWKRMAASVSRLGNRERSALSQSAVRDAKFPAALRLSLPELQRTISARPPHSARDRVLSLLSRTQSRRIRYEVSTQTHDEVVAVLVLTHRTNKQALGRGERLSNVDYFAASSC